MPKAPEGSEDEVWYVIPSANRVMANRTLSTWRDKGYKIALYLDPGAESHPCADLEVQGTYWGWPTAINYLCALPEIRNVKWIVTGGDDMLPDPNKTAHQIAERCTEEFGGTFGVMQPHQRQKHFAGSPWIGVEFRRRMYNGRGPFYPGYNHFCADVEIKEVAEKLQVFRWFDDLNQAHLHCNWTKDAPPVPGREELLRRWPADIRLEKLRRSKGWPGAFNVDFKAE